MVNINHFYHTVKGFSVVNEAEVDVFLAFSCFFYDPMDVDVCVYVCVCVYIIHTHTYIHI